MTLFLLLLSYLPKYWAIKNHPKVVSVSGLFLAKSKCQDGWIIQESIRGVDTCPIKPDMPHFDDLSQTLHCF